MKAVPEYKISNVPTLTTSQLAKRWNCSKRTLENWRWRKEGPPFIRLMKRGSPVVYLLSEIEQFEAENFDQFK